MEDKKGNLGRGLVLHSMVLSLFAVSVVFPGATQKEVLLVCHSTCSVLCYHCLSQYMFCPLLSLLQNVFYYLVADK